jgi:DNA-binding NarL/FixJ family response regulator
VERVPSFLSSQIAYFIPREAAMMRNTVRSAIRVLIVDDHPVVVSGCRSLFASDTSVKIDGAGDAKSGQKAFVTCKPDVTVIDINLPDVSGFELMRRIRKEDPDAKIIMFSMNDDPALVVRAVQMGAQGYVAKGDDPRIADEGRSQGCIGGQFHLAATGGSGDVFGRFHQGQPGVANDRAGT